MNIKSYHCDIGLFINVDIYTSNTNKDTTSHLIRLIGHIPRLQLARIVVLLAACRATRGRPFLLGAQQISDGVLSLEVDAHAALRKEGVVDFVDVGGAASRAAHDAEGGAAAGGGGCRAVIVFHLGPI